MGFFSKLKKSITGSWAEIDLESNEPKIGEDLDIRVIIKMKSDSIHANRVYLKLVSIERVAISNYQLSQIDVSQIVRTNSENQNFTNRENGENSENEFGSREFERERDFDDLRGDRDFEERRDNLGGDRNHRDFVNDNARASFDSNHRDNMQETKVQTIYVSQSETQYSKEFTLAKDIQ